MAEVSEMIGEAKCSCSVIKKERTQREVTKNIGVSLKDPMSQIWKN